MSLSRDLCWPLVRPASLHLTCALLVSHNFLEPFHFRNSVADTSFPSNRLLKEKTVGATEKRSVWTTECCLWARQAGRGSSWLPTPTTPNTQQSLKTSQLGGHATTRDSQNKHRKTTPATNRTSQNQLLSAQEISRGIKEQVLK